MSPHPTLTDLFGSTLIAFFAPEAPRTAYPEHGKSPFLGEPTQCSFCHTEIGGDFFQGQDI
jgi:hypothetical protein